MPFEEVLASCITAIERGATVDDCLARHPNHADALAPLLRTVVELRASPPPRLSAGAFARGRAALAAQARYQERLSAPFLVTPATITQNNHYPPATPTPQTEVQSAALQPPPRSPASFIGRWGNLLASILVVLAVITMSRNVSNSLPGSGLYSIKHTVERLYGYFMSAAGQEALWHARQLERRLSELDRLARQGNTDPALAAAIEQELQQALALGASQPPDERQAFYARWLTELRAVQPGPGAATTTVVTLGRILSTVEAAADAPQAPVILETITPTLSPTATPSPTLLLVEESSEQPTTVQRPVEQVILPTVTPTPPLVASPTLAPTLAPPTSTPIPPAPTATFTLPPPTNTSIPNPAPEDQDEDRDRPQSPPTATPTPLPPVATNTVVPTATPITGASPTVAPTTVTATPRPEATRTGTPPTTQPTATVSKTEGPTATVTPAQTESVTPPPEPSETPYPTDTATPEATPTSQATVETPTETPGATEEPTHTAEPRPTLSFTATPEWSTPEHTPTAEPLPTAEESTPAPSAAPTDEATPDAATSTPEAPTPTPDDGD